jgi:hypothetical protein
MSWNNYDNNRAVEPQLGGIEATIGRSGTQQSGNAADKKQGEVAMRNAFRLALRPATVPGSRMLDWTAALAT